MDRPHDPLRLLPTAVVAGIVDAIGTSYADTSSTMETVIAGVMGNAARTEEIIEWINQYVHRIPMGLLDHLMAYNQETEFPQESVRRVWTEFTLMNPSSGPYCHGMHLWTQWLVSDCLGDSPSDCGFETEGGEFVRVPPYASEEFMAQFFRYMLRARMSIPAYGVRFNRNMELRLAAELVQDARAHGGDFPRLSTLRELISAQTGREVLYVTPSSTWLIAKNAQEILAQTPNDMRIGFRKLSPYLSQEVLAPTDLGSSRSHPIPVTEMYRTNIEFVLDYIERGGFADNPPSGNDLMKLIRQEDRVDMATANAVVARIAGIIFVTPETFAHLAEVNRGLTSPRLTEFGKTRNQSLHSLARWYMHVFGGKSVGQTLGGIGWVLTRFSKSLAIVPSLDIVADLLRDELDAGRHRLQPGASEGMRAGRHLS